MSLIYSTAEMFYELYGITTKYSATAFSLWCYMKWQVAPIHAQCRPPPCCANIQGGPRKRTPSVS